ncbi:MAG: glucosamine inositolphosphorylceramide transferase family protein [Marinilabiliaceae bacterium]
MKKEVIIALETPFVARWFADAVSTYAQSHNVAVSLWLTGSAQGRSVMDRLLSPKLAALFKKVDITGYFPVAGDDFKFPVLDLSRRSAETWPDKQTAIRKIRLQEGFLFTAGGLKGFWHFWVRFFVYGHPLLIEAHPAGAVYGVFFQTRNFTLQKNTGYLRYNLTRILDDLIFDSPHHFPAVETLKCNDRKALLKWMEYPFWRLMRKFREKVAGGRWQLVRLDARLPEIFKPGVHDVIHPPAGRGWADPFLVEKDDEVFLFLEEIVNGKGRIAVGAVDKQTGKLKSRPAAVLEKPTHLSYPFVFQIEGEWYMLPESSASHEVTLYKSVEFPDKWEAFRTVFEGEQWVDTTPFFYSEKWWVFSVSKPASYASSYQELHLFYCDDILHDKWEAHPMNPVVSDVRYARPAGRLFFYEGKLYRPAQNCLHIYGGGVQLCEVLTLSEDTYREQVAGSVHFPWYSRLSSLHTLTMAEDIVIGDCFL